MSATTETKPAGEKLTFRRFKEGDRDWKRGSDQIFQAKAASSRRSIVAGTQGPPWISVNARPCSRCSRRAVAS